MTPEFGYCFRPDPRRDDSSGTLHLWIGHYGAVRFVPTNYDIRHDEWDPVSGSLVIPGDSSGRRRKLTECAKSMTRNLRLVDTIIRDLEASRKRYTADDVANAFTKEVAGSHMLGVYTAILAGELAYSGQARSAAAYYTATRRLVAFNGGYDMHMGEITPEMMRDFQQALLTEGVIRSTVSFYMRALRAIYNKAVAEGIVAARTDYPFDEVYTQVVAPPSQTRITIEA